MAKDLKFNRNALMLVGGTAFIVIMFIFYRFNFSGSTVRVSELISASIVLAERGGKRIVEIRKMDDSEIEQLSKGLTKEGKNEYVTMGDQQSHEIIVSGLKSLWPNLPLQSEEHDRPLIEVDHLPESLATEVAEMVPTSGDTEVPLDDVTVWVDPLDATHEYTEGGKSPELLKYVTVMICIAIRGVPVAGIVHQPYQQNMVTKAEGVTKWAWMGHGISETLVADTIPVEEDSKTVRVIYSRSHSGDVKEVADKAFKDLTVDHRIAAGSGYKVLQVVENKADLYLHTTAIKKWDICAGNALLNAMGGYMNTRRGVEMDYSFIGSEKNNDGLVVAMDKNFNDYLRRVRI